MPMAAAFLPRRVASMNPNPEKQRKTPMAKKSAINKNERRRKLAKKYAPKYAKLKATANDESLSQEERLIARLKMAEIPRNGNPTRIRTRCGLKGRPRAYYRKFHLARVQLRSEESRVGKECLSPGRSWGWPCHYKQ